MAVDYKNMQVGDRAEMPVLTKWEGANQSLFHEVKAYCRATESRPQFEVESVRFGEKDKEIRYFLKRIR